jgi:uncharacterized membrane protein
VNYSGYNLVNTIVYAVILLVISFGLILPWLKRTGLPLNHRFLLALIPFILFGSAFRVLEDLHLLQRSCNPFSPWFYTISPGIFIAVAVLTIVSLQIGIWIAKKNHPKAMKIAFGIGLVMAIPVVVFLSLRFRVLDGFLGVLVLSLAITMIAYFGTRLFQKTRTVLESRLNQLVFFGQMLDASATFTAIQFYHCSEQHVLSSGIINSFSPFAFVIVKFVLILLVLYFADQEIKNEKLRDFIKIVIAIIGFAPGIRDALTLAVGTCL